jgi:hypothetical protein
MYAETTVLVANGYVVESGGYGLGSENYFRSQEVTASRPPEWLQAAGQVASTEVEVQE